MDVGPNAEGRQKPCRQLLQCEGAVAHLTGLGFSVLLDGMDTVAAYQKLPRPGQDTTWHSQTPDRPSAGGKTAAPPAPQHSPLLLS
jgi:hypothetical protein